ncbi:MAG: hypothetical protein K0U34_03270, partial [Alphaproteobacteria bacterium]|nr:hypothetical protein [Alphaproteobacteria bacterium]
MAYHYRTTLKTSSLAIGTLASLATLLAVAVLGIVAVPTGASAQYYTSPYNNRGYRSPGYAPNGYYLKKKRRVRRVRRSRGPKKSRKRRRTYAKTLREPVGKVLLLISLKKQQIKV